MELKVGDRVTSTEVEPREYQNKQLEITDFLSANIVKCKYFLENTSPFDVEYYTVSKDSLVFISHEPLKSQAIMNDSFFKRGSK